MSSEKDSPPPWLEKVAVVVLAVRDDSIRPLAQTLHDARRIHESHIVLHLSGVSGQEALAPLVTTRAALGSLHPLQTIAEPETAPDRLRGAWAAVEGMPRAVEMADWLADTLGGALAVTLYARWRWYRGQLEKPMRWRRKPRLETAGGDGPISTS